MHETLSAAREAHHRRDWQAARDSFTEAAAVEPLSADDAFALADAAWWLGLVDESLAAGEQAYRRYLDGDRPGRAAMAAIHIAVDLLLRGDGVLGSGWLRRAQRLLEDQPEAAEHGYLVYLTQVEAGLDGPAYDHVAIAAARVGALGREHGDPNLVALGILGEGRALLKQGRTAEGFALLDEAMVAVLTEDLSSEWAGNVYCHLMAACHELGDVRRAVAWTRATEEWLRTLPAAVLFTGICRVHRSQVLQATGGWEEAEAEAARVCEDLEHIHVASAAEAHYQVAELCRLRGSFDDAEDAYEQARARGRDPQPGLALLHLARGRPKLAASALGASLAGTDDPLRRLPLRAAQAEIALQAGDLELAGEACDEVAAIADRFGCDGFVATSQTSRAACLLASGQAEPALTLLRTACRTWRELGLPYDAARAGVLLARACAAAGDRDGAARELEAARKLFDRLGAVGDVKIVDGLRGDTRSDVGLTAREIEVLAEVAAGRTNRQIADRFVISERTVERHLSNIFVKLDCGSRTAAAAFAHEQGLVPRAG